MKVKVQNSSSYVKDLSTGAVINTNNHDLQAYKQKRDRDRQLSQLQQNYTTLRDDIDKIKQMLEILVGNNSK